jgi:uncharacterized protein DUF2752
MQVSCGHLGSNETDHELIWLTVSLGSLGIAALWFCLGLPWPRCVFHELTGLPCVTCGMTRSGIEFFHGRFLAALKWNPLVFAFLWGVTALDVYAFAVVTTRAPRFRIVFRSQAEKQYARRIVIASLALNWVYLLSHWGDF